MSAGIYLTLGRIINIYGANLARFSPRTYTLIFVAFDQLSLGVQGVGGTMASWVKIHPASSLVIPSKNIMIIGLAFQVVSTFVFLGALTDLMLRFTAAKARWNPKYLDLINSNRFKLFQLCQCSIYSIVPMGL